MELYELILMFAIAAGAFFAGYQTGRLSALGAKAGDDREDRVSPLPGPDYDIGSREASPSPRRSGAPPPASAGGGSQSRSGSGSAPPRRSTTPPPAAAGLMGSGKTSSDD